MVSENTARKELSLVLRRKARAEEMDRKNYRVLEVNILKSRRRCMIYKIYFYYIYSLFGFLFSNKHWLK